MKRKQKRYKEIGGIKFVVSKPIDYDDVKKAFAWSHGSLYDVYENPSETKQEIWKYYYNHIATLSDVRMFSIRSRNVYKFTIHFVYKGYYFVITETQDFCCKIANRWHAKTSDIFERLTVYNFGRNYYDSGSRKFKEIFYVEDAFLDIVKKFKNCDNLVITHGYAQYAPEQEKTIVLLLNAKERKERNII